MLSHDPILITHQLTVLFLHRNKWIETNLALCQETAIHVHTLSTAIQKLQLHKNVSLKFLVNILIECLSFVCVAVFQMIAPNPNPVDK